MSVPAKEQERVPIGQVLLDDFFLLFLIGVAVPFVSYTVWGLIDIGSIPMAKPIAISQQAAPPLPAGAISLDATLTEFKIQLSQSSVLAGKPIRFNITNKGAIEHDFVIEKVGAKGVPLSAGANDAMLVVGPGLTGYLDWTFADAGEFQIGCHIPGHFEAGMVTKITVTK